MLRDLSQAQGGKKIELEVDGFADGQHFDQHFSKSTGQGDVAASIRDNQNLAQGRASEVARYLQSANPNAVFIASGNVRGHASPNLEKEFPNCVFENGAKKQCGLDCGTRRKVVIKAKLPSGQIVANADGGTFFPKIQDLSRFDKDRLGPMIDREIGNSETGLKKADPAFATSSPKVQSEKIFDQLLKNGSIIPACATDPILKAFTLAHIDSKKEASAQNLKNPPFEKHLRIRMGSLGSQVLDPKDMESLDGGSPTDRFWCFKVKDSFFSTTDPRKGKSLLGKNQMTGRDLIKLLNGDKLGSESTFGVGFNPERVQTVQVRNKSTPVHGFVCRECGSGLSFEKNPQNGGYRAKLNDRAMNEAVDGRTEGQTLIWKAFQTAASGDTFTYAGMSRPRTFVVSGCADCNCDMLAKIRAGGKDVLTIDPLQNPNSVEKIERLSKKQLEDACVFNQPVMHSCLVSPDGEDHEHTEPTTQSLQFFNPITGLVEKAKDLNEALTKITSAAQISCGEQPVAQEGAPVTYQEKINSVACKANKYRNLPTLSEEKDCSTERKALGKN